MTKLICISDTHSKFNELVMPEGDILVHCGDVTVLGTLKEFIEAAKWFQQQAKRYKHIVWIGGNHDLGLQSHTRDIILQLMKGDNIHYLENSEITLEGIKFWGSPYTLQFRNWAFMDEDWRLEPYWGTIPDDVEVVVTHGPSKGILDLTEDGENAGSETLRSNLETKYSCLLHLFGHIHEGYGEHTTTMLKSVNCSVVNRQYKTVNRPVEVIINNHIRDNGWK